MHDLIVAGGGPSGLAVAIGAARAGLDTVVLERRSGVIDKACGEGLMPQALAALHALGVDPEGSPITGITYRQDHHSVHADFRTLGRGVRRTALHDALHRAAREAGVDLRAGSAARVVQRPGHVEVDGLAARYLVGADGLHSHVRAEIGLSGPPTVRPRWGQRRHYQIEPWTSRVEVTWAARSEVYVTPVDHQTVGVAVLTDRRAGYGELLRDFPAVTARLEHAQPVSSVRGAGPLRQPVQRPVQGRVLLVGDAAGYIDALTGEGLALSFAAAAVAVRCLAQDRPQRYDTEWRRLSRRSRWLTAALLAARTNRVIAAQVVPVARRMPWLFGAAVHQLSH